MPLSHKTNNVRNGMERGLCAAGYWCVQQVGNPVQFVSRLPQGLQASDLL
ncbi:hypothetical protein HEQ60_08140 [Haematospirillum sp. H1815]|nr:hypothetical protein [Haematospirillum sp. H1815]NKD77727.1 hypothetical protein [Haematospirillum sp. H1815]